MPFYTFKCRTCGLEKEEMRSMNDFKEPLCSKCCYNTEAQGKYEKMKKIFKPNAKPASKDGSWGFSK
jgi:putative FmdB family regulatory protein